MSDLLNKASLVMIPSGYKEDVVYSAVPGDGSGDMAFTRASNGTRVNSAGLVEVCPWNLLEQSSTFNVSPWAFVGGTTLTSGITDINGTSNAFRYQATSGSYKYGYETVSSTIGQVYTHSIYAKCSSGTQQFKLTDAQQGGGSLQTVTTEWQRFTFTLTATGGNIAIELGSDGTNALDIYICFAQTNIGSTAKPYFPTTDRLNVPRLTYQNGGGGCPSLLLEKQSTNLVTYSEQFDNVAWLKTNATISANATTSPDGTQNADNATPTGTTFHSIQQTQITTGTISYKIYAKYNGYNIWLQIGATSGSTAFFNLQNGTTTNSTTFPATFGTGFTQVSKSITSLGNGWYECNLLATGTSTLITVGIAPDENTASYTANGSSVYLWGAQLEASSYPTSYIPTTSASATRVADFATTNNISSLFGSTEGSFFIEMTYDNGGASGTIPVFLRSSTNSSFLFATYLQFSSNTVQLNVFNSSIQSVAITSSAIFTQGQNIKIAFAYKQNDFVLYVNGNLIGSDTSGNISANLAFIDLGTYSAVASTFQYTGTIGETVLFPTRLTNTELSQLTA